MQPRVLLAESLTPDGAPITLAREGGGALVIRVAGVPLMASRVHGSEEAMAEVGCAHVRDEPGARVLVGGLGMGFTLRATLDVLCEDAQVVVAELLPILVEWNRGPLAALADRPLDDPRVELLVTDVKTVLRSARRSFDAILLDVDNGPTAFTVESNAWLYGPRGLAAISNALRKDGRVVVWSSVSSPAFVKSLARAGLRAEE